MSVENAYHTLYVSALVILSALTLLCLLRAILGPRIADRVVAVNMICTLTLCMICILVVMLGEGYLADVALIYSLLSFLAVVVLCKVFIGVALEKRERREKEAAGDA